MAIIISKVLVVFIYIAIGFAAYRFKIMNDDSIGHLTRFIIYITCPAMLFHSIGGTDLNKGIMFNSVFMMLLSYVVFVFLSIFALWLTRRMKGVEPLDGNVHAFGITSSNSGFMGFPVTQSVFGPLAFYYMVIQNVALNLYMYTFGIWQLNYKSDKLSGKKSFKEMIKPFINPILISSILSTGMFFMGIKLPAYVMDILGTVGDATIPTSMILVGIQLGSSNIKEVIKSKSILFSAFFNLVVFPAIGFAIAFLLPVDNVVRLVFALSLCFPSAAIGVALSASEGRNARLYAELVAATTLLSMITLPVWIVLISNTFPI